MAANSDGRHRHVDVAGDVAGGDAGNRDSDGHRGRTYTRTAGEWLGGSIRGGLFATAAGGVLLGLVWLIANGIHSRFGQYVPVPAIPVAVPIAGALGLGGITTALCLVILRPKRAVDRVSGRDGTTQIGGRVWPGAAASDSDSSSGRSSEAVTP